MPDDRRSSQPLTPWQASLSALDHADRIVAGVQALSQDSDP